MPTDSVQLLDRQHERLRSQDGAAFVHELRVFHEFLTTSGPADVTGALRQLRVDAERIGHEFTAHDEALVPELVELKARLVQEVPETDDSGKPRPKTDWRPPMEWVFTLANFDQLASGGADRLMLKQGYDQSTSGMLLRILENRLRLLQFSTSPDDPAAPVSEDNLRPELDGLRRDLRNLGDRHRHAANTFTNAIETHGGVQVQLLDWAVDEMNPAPVVVATEDDEHAMMDRVFRRVTSGMYAMEDAAAGRQLSGTEADSLTYNVERLKVAAGKVYEAVRLKVAMAPPAAVPTPDYGKRLQTWVLSPGYALVGGPCISGVITQLVQDKGRGAALFLVLTVLAAVLPPLWGSLPELTFTRVSLGFIVVACAAVVVALVTGSLGAAFLVFLLAVVAFSAGDYTGRHRANTS